MKSIYNLLLAGLLLLASAGCELAGPEEQEAIVLKMDREAYPIVAQDYHGRAALEARVNWIVENRTSRSIVTSGCGGPAGMLKRLGPTGWTNVPGWNPHANSDCFTGWDAPAGQVSHIPVTITLASSDDLDSKQFSGTYQFEAIFYVQGKGDEEPPEIVRLTSNPFELKP